MKARQSIQNVLSAWIVKGPVPRHHDRMIEQVAKRWPTLHRALVAFVNDTDKIEADAKIVEAAVKFIHWPENWEMFESIKGSNSLAIPVEFLDLCYAVEEAYGGPKNDDAT